MGAINSSQADYDMAAVKYTKLATSLIMGICLVSIAIYFSGPDWYRNLGAGVLILGAFFLFGALIGFLFGIPKEKNGGTNPDANTGVGTNTNLEQISDWLTKIIVGVGLTQLNSIPGFFKRAAVFFAPAFQNCSTPANFQATSAYQSVVVVIMLLGLVTGFLAGYLFTRLYLAKAFDEGEHELEQNDPVKPTDTKQASGSVSPTDAVKP